MHKRAGLPRAATLAAALAATLAVTLAGCVAGPDYRPPVAGVANAPSAQGPFLSAAGPGIAANAPLPDRWWQLYADPRLDTLVDQALAANADLRAAQANIERAEAVLRESRAGRAITTEIGAGSALTRLSATDAGLPTATPVTPGYQLALSASYPLDLAGRLRRAIEASQADLEAMRAARDYVRVGVVAATTQAYAQVCAANYALAVNRRVVALQRQTLVATRRLSAGGRGTAFDVSRARTAVESSAAALPAYEAQRRTNLYLLATLAGRAPADFPRDVEGCAALPTLAAPLPAGDGAALIRRRADIREAERAIAGDTARLGVAIADLYPQVAIGGSVGWDGPFSTFAHGSSFGFSVGPLLSWSFPNRPVIRARIDQANAQVKGDLARFDAAVLVALRQAESALETYARDRERATALDAARASAAVSADQAGRLFRFGRGDFLSLLDAQRSLATAETAAAAARVQLVQDQIAVFLALGGV